MMRRVLRYDEIQVFVDEASTEITPAEDLIDPVGKLRISDPQNLIDTDFEYGLQGTKWETTQQIANIPTIYSNSGDTPIDELIHLRKLLNRWVLLAYELANLKAQGLIETDTGKTYLEKKNLLEKGEWDSMVPGDRHTSVFFWIATKLNNQSSSMIPSNYNNNLIEMIVSMRGTANDMMDCICTDAPYPYVALCGLLVKLNVLIMSSWAGVRWSIWYWTFGHDIWQQPKIWIDIFVLFTWNISYVCLYDLGYLLYNPFKDRRIDLAHEAISAGLHKLAGELAEGQKSCIPPTMGKLTRPGGGKQ